MHSPQTSFQTCRAVRSSSALRRKPREGGWAAVAGASVAGLGTSAVANTVLLVIAQFPAPRPQQRQRCHNSPTRHCLAVLCSRGIAVAPEAKNKACCIGVSPHACWPLLSRARAASAPPPAQTAAAPRRWGNAPWGRRWGAGREAARAWNRARSRAVAEFIRRNARRVSRGKHQRPSPGAVECRCADTSIVGVCPVLLPRRPQSPTRFATAP